MSAKQSNVMKSHNNQSGIALIQILIIVAILTTIALFMVKSAKQQVQMAQWALDRTQASVIAHGARADVLFELLTNEWTQNTVNSELTSDDQQSNTGIGNENTQNNTTSALSEIASETENEVAIPWNLYNQAFNLNNNVTIKLQDQAGLLNLHYPSPEMLEQVLSSAGHSKQQAYMIIATLLDWQDSDNIPRINGRENSKVTRNGLMPDIRELLLHKTMSTEQLQRVKSNFTLYGIGHLNLMTSPKALLVALSSDSIADEIILNRQQQNMNPLQVVQMMGLPADSEVYFSPSPTVAITITAHYGSAIIKQQLMVKFTPNSQGDFPPYNIMQTKGE